MYTWIAFEIMVFMRVTREKYMTFKDQHINEQK